VSVALFEPRQARTKVRRGIKPELPNKSNIRVAEYLTKLPDMKLLTEKLKLSVELARQKFDSTVVE
jgi:hypothetical protein